MKTTGVVENSGHCIYSIGVKLFFYCLSLFHLVFYIYMFVCVILFFLLPSYLSTHASAISGNNGRCKKALSKVRNNLDVGKTGFDYH